MAMNSVRDMLPFYSSSGRYGSINPEFWQENPWSSSDHFEDNERKVKVDQAIFWPLVESVEDIGDHIFIHVDSLV